MGRDYILRIVLHAAKPAHTVFPVAGGEDYNPPILRIWGGSDGQKKATEVTRYGRKIIKPIAPQEPEKAQIAIVEGEALYREIRVDNVVADDEGGKARLIPGAEVDVILEADSNATIKMPEDS